MSVPYPYMEGVFGYIGDVCGSLLLDVDPKEQLRSDRTMLVCPWT
jgi:hypothetical protein